MFAAVLTGWYVGFLIGAVVIVLVVVLVAMLLTLAARIAKQAVQIDEALEEARVNTLPLWDVAVVNDLVADIINHATDLRLSLTEEAS